MSTFIDSVGDTVEAEIVSESRKVLGMGSNPIEVVPGDILIEVDDSGTFDVIRGVTPESMGWYEADHATEDVEL